MYKKFLKQINHFKESFIFLSDEELKKDGEKIREEIQNNKNINNFIAKSFALCGEVLYRLINKRPYEVQMLGAIALHFGKIAEIKTGEGKTIIAAMAAYLNALTGKPVHIMTANEYLVKRDCNELKKVYEFLGLSCSYISETMDIEQKKKAYKCNIVYGTNSEFAFDYLKDNVAKTKKDIVQNGFNYAIIDEADNSLIDEARVPLILSGSSKNKNENIKLVDTFVKKLKYISKKELSFNNKKYDYVIDKKQKSVYLSDIGVSKAEVFFNLDNLNAPDNLGLLHLINLSLKANSLMEKDKDYVVKDNKIILVDTFTGRLSVEKKFSEGLHQALEAKEGLEPKGIVRTFASISSSEFLKLYKKIAGMTGTAKTEAEEFQEIYSKDIIVVPTNKPMIRKDLKDIIFKTHNEKNQAIIKKISEIHATGQPILVGTASVESSLELSNILKKNNINHNLLNAVNNEKEAYIIAQAGKIGAITIATNMAGRGTDIMLGGNPEYLTKYELINTGYSSDKVLSLSYIKKTNKTDSVQQLYNTLYEKYKEQTTLEKNKVIEVGGLFVLGTEHYEARRIDNQLRGRAGRQGEPGISQFYISLDDNIVNIYSNPVMLTTLRNINNESIVLKLLSHRTITTSQKKNEQNNFESRRTVHDFDKVNGIQRNIIYTIRKNIIKGNNINSFFESLIDSIPDIIIKLNKVSKKKGFSEDALNSIKKSREILFDDILDCKDKPKKDIKNYLCKKIKTLYDEKILECQKKGANPNDVMTFAAINLIDKKWCRYLDQMSNLKELCMISSFGAMEPLIKYKQDSSVMFSELTDIIKIDILISFLKMSFN